MKKNYFKLILDIAMFLCLTLLYKKSILKLQFHEIAGVFVCLLALFHTLLNRKWIIGVTKNLFGKNIPVKTKISWWLNLILAIDFIVILVSGIGISRTVFHSLSFLSDKGVPVHMFCGAVALVIVGIHVGLHWTWIHATMFKSVFNKSKAAKVIGSVILIAFTAGGVYSFNKSDLIKYLSIPFISAEGHSDHEEEPVSEISVSENMQPGQEVKQGKNRKKGGKGKNANKKISPAEVASYSGRYLLILVLIAEITALTEALIIKFKNRKNSSFENLE